MYLIANTSYKIIMSDYTISQIRADDKRNNRLIDELLETENIRRDKNLDYTCAMFDDNMNVVATGSCFGNTLRCMAVSSLHQGEGLMNQIVSHLIEVQCSRGNIHLFLYTKCSTAKFFRDLGFYEIAQIDDNLVFMENRRTGFSDYLKRLSQTDMNLAKPHLKSASVAEESENLTKENINSEKDNTSSKKIASIVMNANPFTLGHQYLVEKASLENDIVHIFIVSEDASLVPFDVRKKLVKAGTSHLNNIVYHDSGPYIISNATFPSYFQKDESAVIEGHALLDITIFTKIASILGINKRYVGEEPNSIVTNLYNKIMAKELPKHDIECIVVPRKDINNEIISASTVRKAIKAEDLSLLKKLVPEATFNYFTSEEALPIIQKIKATNDVIHY